ncbi:MAG: TonB-dependent receptor plug domain-containing protein [Vicinamibacterales bacterium]
MGAALVIAAIAVNMTPAAAQELEQYKGRLLVDVLRTLQTKGLRIVFSSATVTPQLRVLMEPRATRVRRQLDELLAPHGLIARNGPGGTIQIVRGRATAPEPPATGIGTTEGQVVDAPTISPVPATHREYVSVSRPAPTRQDQGVASETSVDRSQLERLYGSLADDPVRIVQAFPRVTPVDEFHSEFVVRGSPFRHVNLVIDGVSTQWLQHTAHRRAATGSLPMLAGYAVSEATLRAGAYPRRYGDRLGPQLDLTLREGSRADFTLRGAIGGSNATLVGEGPLGKGARGSWLVAARQSYLEWPPERSGSTRTAFGFSDGLAKVVYDVRPTQQVSLTALSGLSSIEGEDDLAPHELGAGMNRATSVSASWRSTLGPAVVLNQRAYVVTQRFLNKYQTGRESDGGANQEVVYRADLTRPIGSGLLEGGAQLGRTAIDDVHPSGDAQDVAGSSWLRSGYVHFAWAATPGLTVSPGMRVTTSTRLPHPSVTRWLLGEWAFRPNWTLSASAGASRQLPELRHVLGDLGSPDLRPERATHVDVGIERRLANSLRWQATVFSRKEDDILREPEIHPRLVGGAIVLFEGERYTNALQGTSRGIELMVDRRSPLGLSGWAAYSYGKTRYTDVARHETYWGDFDQRHAFTLFGAYRFSPRTSAGATFRAGSNFPISGRVAAHDGRLFVAGARNQVRLPPHVRLDLRADRDFEQFGRRFTLFVEVLNVLNRANVAVAGGSVNPDTGEALGFTDVLFRRRLSGGIVLEF